MSINEQYKFGDLMKNMIELNIEYRKKYLETFGLISNEHFLRDFCTVSFSSSRRLGHSFNAIKNCKSFFGNPVHIYPNCSIPEYLINEIGEKHKFGTLRNLDKIFVGVCVDAIIVDVPRILLSERNYFEIYGYASRLINKSNYHKFTILLLN